MLQRRVHAVYEPWSGEHIKDLEVFTLRPFDPEEDYQRVDIAQIPADLSFENAQLIGSSGMGEAGYLKLSDGFEHYELIKESTKRRQAGKSTLVTTPHLRNVLDTAITHNNFFVTSGGDPEVGLNNDIVVSPMLTRINILGAAVMKVLSASGPVDLALPREAAIEHGMAETDAASLDWMYSRALARRIKEGVVLHWALPKSRAKKIVTASGELALSTDRVEDSVADYVARKKFLVFPVSMDVPKAGEGSVDFLEPREISSSKAVHDMMEELVDKTQEVAGEQIYYGTPPGAVRIDKINTPE